MKKVCVFVGSRANYSSCKSIMRAVQKHPGLRLQTILGAAAVLDRYGNIEKTILNDGFTIDTKFYMIVEGENPITMAQSTGLGIVEVSMIFDNLKPDIVLVVGDRFDVMAPTIAASYMNILIAHTMGGELSGTIDESIRHAITKMSHIHFPANEDARNRIKKMGEDPDMVFNVGCPRLDLVKEMLGNDNRCDLIRKENFFDTHKGVGGEFDLERGKFLLVSQHPVTTEFGNNRKHVEETLHALNEIRMPTIMLWPNIDAGSDEISKGIRTFREKQKTDDWLFLLINLPIEVYINLMDMCSCMIGNSSSLIREGSFLGIPAVNIGTRQKGRLRGKNVIDVDYDREIIKEAINEQLREGRTKSENIYGTGEAGKNIAGILSSIKYTSVQKSSFY